MGAEEGVAAEAGEKSAVTVASTDRPSTEPDASSNPSSNPSSNGSNGSPNVDSVEGLLGRYMEAEDMMGDDAYLCDVCQVRYMEGGYVIWRVRYVEGTLCRGYGI